MAFLISTKISVVETSPCTKMHLYHEEHPEATCTVGTARLVTARTTHSSYKEPICINGNYLYSGTASLFYII